MFTRGEFTSNNVTYGVIMSYTKACIEAILVTSGTVVSAYKTDATGSYSYNNVRAKELVQLIKNGVKGCTSKNGTPMPFELGAMTQHEFTKTKVEYIMQMHKGEVVGAYIQSGDKRVELAYNDQCEIPANIPYIKLTEVQVKKELDVAEDDLDAVPVRSVQEIALEKDDLTWLQNKKYYIVNDDETAEKLFTFLDNYNGAIAYDTETTGLRINCFGKINSEYSKSLQKYNEEHPDEQIRSDRLVGIIFCVENDTSYYFPCFNRKFKNLYEDIDSPIRNRIINNIKARYTIGDRKDSDGDMRDYVLNTPADQFRLDVILMERVRDILHTKHIVAHNGTFEWKVGWQYEIDTNLTDDTMIMHQLMYKFRSTTSNRGEPSNLKYLAKRELGIDQWELSDFFPDWKADSTGTVRTKAGAKAKKSGSRIDFSYMDYEGTRVYAPTDGDVTFLLYNLYKKDMKKNHADMEYIYSVEIIVSCAIAYMEFYGHRLDESKILGAREQTRANIAMIVSEIRQLISYSNNDEVIAYNNLKQLRKDIDAAKGDEKAALEAKLPDMVNSLNSAIDANTDKVINLASPAQVCDLFYNKMKIPVPGDKQSVAKKEIKALLKEKDENGKDKYPIVHMYSKYKNEDTLMTKFFDNLPYFMYPGGYIFSSFGQISTATGRMSCSRPNAQQYPKVITKIVSPRPGFVMMDADYSQIEYRVLTALAKNTELAKLFSHPDSDYHTLMASLMYSVPYASVTPQMRSAAKSFNFGIPYGMGIKSLSILLNGKSDKKSCDEAMEKYELYFKNQPRTRKFFDDIKEMAQVNGYTKTLFNRYRYYSFTDKDGNVNNGKRAAALRQAGNAVIQGCLGPDTLIETKELGVVRIEDAVGYSGDVWNGTEWTHGDVLYSGKKQKCIITFGDNEKFICSPIHKFLESGKDPKKIESYIECKDLTPGTFVQCNTDVKSELTKFSKATRKVAKGSDIVVGTKVKSVEITDEYIDMYDVCNTDCGYYVADGLITHNTAADIFKIGVARNFSFIRRNNLFGKMLIINMIHDEQLMEVDVQHLNMQRILAEVGKNMQFHIDGFPPLYIGAGIGPAWGYAKGKMAEIHPLLLEQFTKEAESIPIYREDCSTPVDTKEVLDYFQNRVYEFRRKKVADYLADPANWHQDIHPAIGGLINLQFNYGRGDDAKAYVGPNGEKYNDTEFLMLNIADFLKENNIDAKPEYFTAQEQQKEVEEDNSYDDSDEEEPNVDDMVDDSAEPQIFSKIDESNKLFGASLHDYIGIFGTCILEKSRVCGIDTRNLHFRKRDAIIAYLMNYICDEDDPDGNQIVFLTDGNILKYTGIYVKGLKASELEANYKIFLNNSKAVKSDDSDYQNGDIDNRSQAK